MVVLTGCQPQSEGPSDENTTVAQPQPRAAEPAAVADVQSAEQRPEVVTAMVSDPAPSAGSAQVVLGSPELTAGIPGEGDLTIEEIQRWLDKPENHIPLEVTLPDGLAAAAANIQGLEENPLTRAKIELGRQLYFDTRLSSDGSISCASCHHPGEGYARHTQFGVGVDGKLGGRNSPVTYNRILSAAQFWDGRAATLEEQAAGPVANPIEMANTPEACTETVGNVPGYRIQFERIFPGEGVTMETITKAIASFERVIVTGPAPYDYYELVRNIQSQFDNEEIEEVLKEDAPDLYARYQEAVAKTSHLSESAIRGRELFFQERSGCTACHAGANFSDEQYHNLGVGMDKPDPDLGRYVVTGEEKDKGAFKTPTLRNVVYSYPYMHDGSQATLEEVVEWYDKGGHPNPYLSDKVKKLNLTDQEKADLVAFMKEMLTSEFPEVETGRLPQ